MKNFARSGMDFLIAHGMVFYYVMLVAIVVILVLSVISAHRNRGHLSYVKKEKPLSSRQYFEATYSEGTEANDEDYLRYRSEFTNFSAAEEDEESLTWLEYLAETYAPKLIRGCVISLILMAVVAAPYLVIRFFG